MALVTCAEVPDLDAESRGLIEPLASRGVDAAPAVWSDPRVDWANFDLAVIRSCWDYAPRHAEFVSWAASVPRLSNPADILAWNTDKRYLADLAAGGVQIVPTSWLDPSKEWIAPDSGEVVIKPAVSMASLDTGRYDLHERGQRTLASAHVRRLQNEMRTVMVQPYMHAIDDEGETSLIFIGHAFSHAVRKSAVLEGPDDGSDRRFDADGGTHVESQTPTAAQIAVADQALRLVPGGPERLLYARVDLVPGPDGPPLLMELELVEPHLYLAYGAASIDRFAAAIASAMR